MLDDTAQRVAVSSHNDAVHLLELREDGCLPERHHAGYAVFEALRLGKILCGHLSVARISEGRTRSVSSEVVRSYIVAAAPLQHLLVTILLGGLLLVEALESTIVLLVETPSLHYGDPVFVHSVEHVVERLHGTLQIGSVGDVEMIALFLHQSAGIKCLFLAFFSKINVGPSCETVLKIPLALAVADKYYSFHCLVI